MSLTLSDYYFSVTKLATLWLLHLTGGTRATWGEGGNQAPAELKPTLLSGNIFRFAAGDLRAVIQQSHRYDLRVFGVCAFTHQLQLKGIVPAEWRPLHYAPHKAWLCSDAKTGWSQIAYAAAQAKSGRLWDCGARIAYQIETCLSRLRQVSEGYANQLESLLARRQFPEGRRINDIWTQDVFLTIQSFLTDACVLRDYLAEFAAEFLYRVADRRRITTLASLLKYIGRAKLEDNFTAELRQACDSGGWLWELGHYRDLVAHSAPLALAQRRLWVWCKAHELPGNSLLPTLRFPLPLDPAGIRAIRSTANYDDFERFAQQFTGPADVDSSMKDALTYAHEVVGQLGSLAMNLAAYSPVSGQIPTLTEKDIIGPIRWDSHT